MPRTTYQPPEGAEAIRPEAPAPGHLQVMSKEADTVGEAQRMFAQWMDVAGDLGFARGLAFHRTIGDVALLATFQKLKEDKKYKGLPYTDQAGNLRHVADLEEACRVFLGKSYRRMREIESVAEELGEELYETAARIGLGQRHFNAIKTLPDESQSIVKQAIASENKERVVELLHELSARFAKDLGDKERDIAAKDADLASTKADLEAARKRADARQKRIDALEDEREKLQQVIAKADPDERRNALLLELTRVTARLDETIRGDLWATISALREHEDATDIPIEGYLRGVMATLRDGIADLEEAFNIRPEIGVEYPSYLLDQIDAAAPTDRNGPDDVAH